MTAQVRGLTQAARNANDGISLAQTAEGNLNEINNNLQRVRELAVQAANGTNSADDLTSIKEEITARVAEIDRIAGAADFNGTKLLDGSQSSISIQVGAGASTATDAIDVTLTSATSSALGIGTLSVSTQSDAYATITAVDAAIKSVDSARSGLGAIQNRFESTISNLNNTITNLSASRSRIEDADYAVEVSNMTRAQILQQAGTSVLAQANQVPQTVLSLLR
jgi:flagellin